MMVVLTHVRYKLCVHKVVRVMDGLSLTLMDPAPQLVEMAYFVEKNNATMEIPTVMMDVIQFAR